MLSHGKSDKIDGFHGAGENNTNLWSILQFNEIADTLLAAVKNNDYSNAELIINNIKHDESLIKALDIFIKDAVGDSLLHWATAEDRLYLIRLLLDGGVDVNVKNISNKTALELLLRRIDFSDQHQVKILKYFLKLGAFVPQGYPRLYDILIRQPKVGVVEVYDDETSSFVPANKYDYKNTRKKPIVLMNAEYDKTPRSEYYGAIKQFYAKDYYTQRSYAKLAKHFIVFRVLINCTQQIEPLLEEINLLYARGKVIQHLMIHAHANQCTMQLGDGVSEFSMLHSEDANNNFAMTKSFRQLAPHATIALFGCNTAYGQSHLTKEFSKMEIAQGRLVFGTANLVTWIHYLTVVIEGVKIPLPFFRNHPGERELEVFKEGEEIASGYWKTRSML